jgi:hypothetical protein
MDKAKLIATLCLPLLVGFCSAGAGNLCSAGPIILDAKSDERLTRPEKEQIVGLNGAGREICGWRSLS